MGKNELQVDQVERFVFDFEKLYQLSFDHSEYDISQSAVILRKFLLDKHNVTGLARHLIDEKITFLSLRNKDKLESELLSNTKIYIPILDVLPVIRITNYYSIKISFLEEKKKDGGMPVQYSEIEAAQLAIDKFISEDLVVLDGEYINRKDIIEYLCYGKGAVHYGIDAKKVDRLSKVTNLNFSHAMGKEKADSVFSWATSFRTPEYEKQYLDKPELTTFMMKLGDKHSFETIMLLQIGHEIKNSASIAKLFFAAKEYLIKNTYKYKDKTIKDIFMNV